MATPPQTIRFSDLVRWSPKQQEADGLIKNHKYILYGGAMGGGKSYWLRWEAVKLLLYYFAKYKQKGVRVGLFCEDYPALKDRQISKLAFEFPEWLGRYQAQDHNFVLAPEYGGGVIAFRNLDDVSKYQSSEFAAELVDELTKNTREVFDFLRTRLRWPGIEDTKFLGGTNPGGIGHAWVKKFWIDREFDPTEREAHLFAFCQALASDNPHLSQTYYQSLEGLPDEMRRAYLEGDWNIFKGQYFTEWRNEIHTCDPFPIPSNWVKFISLDYGYSKPSAVIWWATDYDGNLYAYRELYTTQLTFRDLAKEVLKMTPTGEQMEYLVADPAIWNKTGATELSGAEMMLDEFQKANRFLPLIPGNNDRINGWRIYREWLKPFEIEGKKTARLKYFKTCKDSIRTIPALIYDSIRVEDLDSKGEDHAADSSRYGIMSRPQPTDRPHVVKDRTGELWDMIDQDLKRITAPPEETTETWG